jgi:hypothetical protein
MARAAAAEWWSAGIVAAEGVIVDGDEEDEWRIRCRPWEERMSDVASRSADGPVEERWSEGAMNRLQDRC